jgi:uncharacterized membrane protein
MVGRASAPDVLADNVAQIVQLEQRDRIALSRSDQVANWLAASSGRISFAVLHVVWFVVWIAWNAGWVGLKPFDPYPFGLLTVIVSLESIFLSTFVLISQNQQALVADRRAKVDLQVNLLSEQETTKILTILTKMSAHLQLPLDMADAAEAQALERPTQIAEVMDTIDALEQQVDPKGAKGPDSAADTDA